MNESGMAVAPLVRRFGIEDLGRLVVVHDELDLEPGVLRLKEGGGLAGHNGLRSIAQHLKSRDFLRVRIGVGKPRTKELGADHVLSRLGRRAREQMDVTIQEAAAADAVEAIVTLGIEPAMTRYNIRA
jgi:PTH1 family peptidyl-tRNA hydrolase